MAILLLLTVLSILAPITYATHNLYFHPLAHHPGPLLWRAFRLPFTLSMIRGELPHRIRALHEQYGDVVRVAPNELSFIDPAAWRDIYTRGRDFVRPDEYKDQPPGKTAENLIACSEAKHAQFRKILAPGFSERYAAEQEPYVQSYIDQLCERLDERADVDVVEWINYVAFDIIGDLTWGSSFGCLDGLAYHPWIQTVSQFKAAIIVGALKFYPLVYAFLMAITPASALSEVMQMWKVTEEKVRRRVASGETRPDLVGTMMQSSKEGEGMTGEEMEVNAMMIVAAGSESITTVLTGVINHLLRNPRVHQTLVDILRGTFSSSEDITASSLKNVPYLNAVLNEGMRLCPTIPDAMRRSVPAGGATIAGRFVPGGMVVSVPPWATYRTSRNFTRPNEFAPERWLDDVAFKNDVKTAFNPFSLGPHNCPGQNLAWLELRLILANLLWRYDIYTPPGVELPEWESQGIWWFWDKKPTMVRFSRFR
ncbi:cytochrome P450 [Aspergillus steynii IBT 23096]|uniref:Cytochrome P450 n=1 Tax=Aspergillus steynii IBT 23096 TaxID=1392250 RepID=A0A2I2GEH9_9EURO|nr:cytochrome P450 [Aspergillus steynii IBT 23096]PLB51299.1 cytochrome P450 [Aspergillus steynii IBT 23096]